ncbi:MFS transporter [Plantibacter sp. VKM Ac-2885]|uniref:MFS transporter n=1 Tax=Plantibacter TaxID=190323 RepID=UPI00177C0A7C|nr:MULTISPECIES: MFS transporter [Plantibacter]MBD8103477.1 MFS transporter [Plantibacter sp. CFBP 8775]MBD8516669.1 MFS transporter [Plantibacter sp. CFBP 8804]MBF4514470.1 MFS transporter [Plantibacter sp. VKM Ac-2885]CAH0162558.1 Inner membrane transport protein YdhP [Plantibacter cousiniae]
MPTILDGSTQLSPTRVRLAILALAVGAFGIGTTEFVAMGLLPNIATDLLPELAARSQEQANAQAAWLITAYALGVVVGAPTIAALVARYRRKTVLLWLGVAFTVGTLASALLPSFGLVLLARFVAALPHGAYFGMAALVAASLMGPGKRGKGVALVMTGLTIANVVGVPFATWVGQEFGWRSAYLIVTGIFALATVTIWFAVPVQAGNPQQTMRRELRVFRRGQVWFVLGFGSIGFGGLFAVYSYLAPLVTEVAGESATLVPWALATMGVGMTIGNLVGGHLADRGVKRALIVFFALMIVVLTALALTATWTPTMFLFVFAVGFASQGLGPAIQTRLMDVAGDSQSLAAALNHSALNIGNALGAFLGGVVIAGGLGYLAPVWTGVVLTVIGLGIVITSFTVERRQLRRELLRANDAEERRIADRNPPTAPIPV